MVLFGKAFSSCLVPQAPSSSSSVTSLFFSSPSFLASPPSLAASLTAFSSATSEKKVDRILNHQSIAGRQLIGLGEILSTFFWKVTRKKVAKPDATDEEIRQAPQ